jgi:hypothetical protein
VELPFSVPQFKVLPHLISNITGPNPLIYKLNFSVTNSNTMLLKKI